MLQIFLHKSHIYPIIWDLDRSILLFTACNGTPKCILNERLQTGRTISKTRSQICHQLANVWRARKLRTKTPPNRFHLRSQRVHAKRHLLLQLRLERLRRNVHSKLARHGQSDRFRHQRRKSRNSLSRGVGQNRGPCSCLSRLPPSGSSQRRNSIRSSEEARRRSNSASDPMCQRIRSLLLASVSRLQQQACDGPGPEVWPVQRRPLLEKTETRVARLRGSSAQTHSKNNFQNLRKTFETLQLRSSFRRQRRPEFHEKFSGLQHRVGEIRRIKIASFHFSFFGKWISFNSCLAINVKHGKRYDNKVRTVNN